MGSETVPEGVATGGFGDASGLDGVFDRVLQVFLPHVVAPFLAAARVEASMAGGAPALHWGCESGPEGARGERLAP